MSTLALSVVDAKPGREVRVLLYHRISHDRENNRLAIARQEEDLRRWAAARGWIVVAIYVDNDITASGKRSRPDWDRLMEDLRRGRGNAVLGTEIPRLGRNHRDMVDLYEWGERNRGLIGWGATGLASFRDKSSSNGLLEFGLHKEIAINELRVTTGRVLRKHAQLRDMGMPTGGSRCCGYQPSFKDFMEPYTFCLASTRAEVTIDEPAMIQQAVKEALAGKRLHAIARDWNELGFRGTKGSKWTHRSVRQILVNPAISGRRGTMVPEEDAEGNILDEPRTMPRVVGKAVWEGIITPAQSDQVRAYLANPERVTHPTWSPTNHPLSGLLVCGVCGGRMYSAGKTRDGFRCESCKGNSIVASTTLQVVTRAVLNAIENGAIDRLASAVQNETANEATNEALAELREIERQQAEVATDRALGNITRAQMATMNQILSTRQKAAEAIVQATQRRQGLEGIPMPLTTAGYHRLDVNQQRLVIHHLISRIVVAKSARRCKTPSPFEIASRLEIVQLG